MENKTYKTVNDLTMVESKPLCWVRNSKYVNPKPGDPYIYNIYVGGMAGGWNCTFEEETMILRISSTMDEGEQLEFKVKSLEFAGEIVASLAEGHDIDLSETIYNNKHKK